LRGLLSSDTSEIEVGNMKREQYNHREQERRLWNKWQNSDKRRLFNEQKQKPLQALMFWNSSNIIFKSNPNIWRNFL